MRFYNDFQIGDKIITKGRTITEADIVNFAAFSGDWNPLHTDDEYAKKGPFGERIAHGFLVLTVGSGLMPLEEMSIIAFYGMDRVRFVNPTRIGDTLRVEMEAVEKKGKDETKGIVSFQTSIKNQRGEDMAVFIMKLLIGNSGAG